MTGAANGGRETAIKERNREMNRIEGLRFWAESFGEEGERVRET